MSQSKRVIVIAAASLVLIFAIKTVVAFVRYSRVKRGFASIHVGESRAVVISNIGNPNYHAGKCGVIHDSGKNCALEYLYSHPFAPFVPNYYIVSFSPDDRVIEAEPWSSP